ncbi:MAG: glucosyl-3-phosphoglycerate synthase [Verrucomicrobiales bacterium]
MTPARPEAEITAEVEAWFSSRTRHHREFSIESLLAGKDRTGERIALVIPTLNEASTIGDIVSIAHHAWMEETTLLDEIHVIDSGSTDATRAIAKAAGAHVHLASTIAPQFPSPGGKGENLWKAGLVSQADIFCFIDGDISNFQAWFVSGLLGPLLDDETLLFSKAFYERPLAPDGGQPDPGGGRVTEILIRPIFSLHFPELAGIIQPLSGEYAMRRSLHRALPFPSGYGVEAAHLVDILRGYGLNVMAQVDLEHRRHRVRTTTELGPMASGVLHALWPRLPGHDGLPPTARPAHWHHGIAWDGNSYSMVPEQIGDIEFPPLAELKNDV